MHICIVFPKQIKEFLTDMILWTILTAPERRCEGKQVCLGREETESRSISVRSSFEPGTKYYPIQTRLDKFDSIRPLNTFLRRTGYAFVLSATLQNTELPHSHTEQHKNTVFLQFSQTRLAKSLFLWCSFGGTDPSGSGFWRPILTPDGVNSVQHLETCSWEKGLKALFALGLELSSSPWTSPACSYLPHLQNESRGPHRLSGRVKWQSAREPRHCVQRSTC